MAESNYNIVNVLLGYQDELISEKYVKNVNYTTNKIGGKPDWPPTNFEKKVPKCPLCELDRPLILQIYAPIENSQFHRTLYIFACINPNCWNQNESWICLRTQLLDTTLKTETNSSNCLSSSNSNSNVVSFDWCENSDDWGDNYNNNDNFNGNVVTSDNNIQVADDDDDDSYSFEEQMSADLNKKLNFDDRNANTGLDSEGVGAVGRQNSPIASAEIENDESELVTIDAPILPQNDLHALLHAVAPLPHELCSNDKSNSKTECKIQFLSFFINVSEEFGGNFDKNDLHIRDLLQEYQQKNDENLLNIASNIPIDEGGENANEKYEKSVPAHGDKYFHYFLNRIQQNPGQILRYQRGGTPLILYPIQDHHKKCRYCSSEMIFELQILPTLIPKLRLNGIDENFGTRIEFGNILIYTCSNSCWGKDTSQQFREEIIIVQSEK